ncbi:uncharacterized protein PV09_00700 [Verruconis gallopava]|uniref:Nodulin-like domain-containing protein n=1 Tax=Verruconis gallopava TaxID=253628 RepID=A0A0D1Z721_9PEZI|nr:uncharacterized protein PV09_00700 [Verruconis gallopava]KIW08762.1 hypothetical protein PV09_00700 [Verruconis gallopava]
MLEEQSHRTRRKVAVVAATLISLACGTNYAYSAWAPQFAERMHLSSTQSNLIGSMGNIGMYASGIPLGYMVDHKGPRPGVLLGSFALGAGFYPIKLAYDGGVGSMSVFMLCFFSFLTGFGSCSAFQAAIKTAALNWPLHRGTATAFPLAAFGLSAVFFTTVSHIFLGDDVGEYLLLLAIGTVVLTFTSFFFVTVPHAEQYRALAHSEPRIRRDSNPLQKQPVWKVGKGSRLHEEPDQDEEDRHSSRAQEPSSSESASLLSDGSSIPGDIQDSKPLDDSGITHSHRADVSGFMLLRKVEFYSLWVMLGVLTGIGLMTINNIGNNVQALWYNDPDADTTFIMKRQLMHVSIISVFSFLGRLLSGIGSDVLVKRLHMSRFWCLVCSSCVFTLAQVAGLNISDPHYLWVLSSLTGLAYGALFGVYPALVADTFGVTGLSVNWGFMTLAPVVMGNIFNLAYGAIYDRHSVPHDQGHLVCEQGLECYKAAYLFTFFSSLVGIVCTLWCIWYEDFVRAKREQEALGEHHA